MSFSRSYTLSCARINRLALLLLGVCFARSLDWTGSPYVEVDKKGVKTTKFLRISLLGLKVGAQVASAQALSMHIHMLACVRLSVV